MKMDRAHHEKNGQQVDNLHEITQGPEFNKKNKKKQNGLKA